MKISTTMDSKDTTIVETPTIIAQAPPKPSNLKYKITIAVLATVTILAVIGAFLGVFYFHTTAIQNVIRYQHTNIKDESGHDAQEDVELDDDSNTAKFTVRGKDGQTFTVIEDYDRKLAVMESTFDNEPSCTVYVLDKSISSTRDLTDMPPQTAMGNTTHGVTHYVQDARPVTQTDFLSAEAQNMCAGKPVYWAKQKCGNGEVTENGHRQKRASGFWCWVCVGCPCGGTHCYFGWCQIRNVRVALA